MAANRVALPLCGDSEECSAVHREHAANSDGGGGGGGGNGDNNAKHRQRSRRPEDATQARSRRPEDARATQAEATSQYWERRAQDMAERRRAAAVAAAVGAEAGEAEAGGSVEVEVEAEAEVTFRAELGHAEVRALSGCEGAGGARLNPPRPLAAQTGELVGPGGSKLNALRAEARSASISLSPASAGEYRTLLVRGPRAAVEKAARLLRTRHRATQPPPPPREARGHLIKPSARRARRWWSRVLPGR